MTEKRFPSYPEYKDSSVKWGGEIPAHWETYRLKHVATINDEALPEDTNPDYEISYIDIGNVDATKGIVAQETYTFAEAPSRARRVVHDGDVIVSTVRTYLRAIAPIANPEPNLIVSTGFAVIRPRSGLLSRFAAYALRAPYFVDHVVAESVGVSYPAINAWQLGTFRIGVPTEEEQRAIADFLDRETAKIDAFVEKKVRLIDLLQEKRTALITHAVTKGLDPNVPMKDSGIEWLGEIPAHWETRCVKHVCAVNMGQSPPGEECGADIDGLPFLQGNAEFGWMHPSSTSHCLNPPKVAPAGSILLSVRAPVGALNIADTRYGIGRGLCALTPNKQEGLHYLWYLLHIVRHYLSAIATGSTYDAVAADDVGAAPVCVPTIEEQQAIADFLDRETAKIDALIIKVHEAIERLKEYRTALISAAVTGKIDVRNS